MKIEVKNFGPIKKGTIDLDKKVTVFVGYNNSGKTYMSQLLWRLNSSDEIYFESGNFLNDGMFQSNSITITRELVSKILEGYAIHVGKNILPDLFNVKSDYFSNDYFSLKFIDEVHSFLGALKSTSFSYYFSYRELEETQNYYSGYVSFKKSMDTLDISIRAEKFEKPQRLNEINVEIFDIPTFFVDVNSITNYSFKKPIADILLSQLFDRSNAPFFLPANRVFYPSYYKYIYSIAKEEKELIDDRLKKNSTLESIKALSKSPYTKATDGLIEKVYDLNKNLRISAHYKDLLTDLKEIIGGDIIIKSVEGIAPIEFFLKLDNGKELDMYMSSSSANQLATLYLYLQFWAENENNYLIIDEPEENLHPENQIKLVNLLMKFADRGNKVLITTHSPLIADLVNNYANLSSLNESGIKTNDLIKEGSIEMVTINHLKHTDYGVYFFNGESIDEYAFDSYGAYFKDFRIAEDKVKKMSNILKENIYNNINSDARKSLQNK